MSKPTPEKTHALLEKLAEYVMSKLPTREEMQVELEKKADKKDVEEIKQKVDLIINNLDKQAKQLDDIKTEQISTNSALLRHEKRIEALEESK